MNKIFLVGLALFVLSGCQVIDQIKADYKLGKETRLEEGEASPKEKASGLATAISGVPYIGVAAPVVAILGTFMFTWVRGRRIRKETLPENPKPITGEAGKAVGVEAVVQHTSNLAAGALEVGKPESSFKEGWQYTLISSLGIMLAPMLGDLIQKFIPYFQDNHPAWISTSMMAVLIGLLGALRVWLSKVEPLKKVS